MRRYVFIGLAILAFEGGPAQAVLIDPPTPPAAAVQTVDRVDAGGFPASSWNWDRSAVRPSRGFSERVLTLPNIAIVLTGMAWMALVRRQQGARRRA